MTKASDLDNRYVRTSDPVFLWSSLFDCEPSDTDAIRGTDSVSVVGIEAALASMGPILDSRVLGAPFSFDVDVDKGFVSALRKKLMSAVVLDGIEAGSKSSHRTTAEPMNYGSGIFLIVGHVSSAVRFLERMKVEGISKIISFDDGKHDAAPVFVMNGNIGARIEVKNEDYIRTLVEGLVNEHAELMLMNGNVDVLEIMCKSAHHDLTPFIHVANEDDRRRFNEVLKFSRRMIDNGDCSVGQAIKKSPYRLNLIQGLVDRVLEKIEHELTRFGLGKTDENIYQGRYGSMSGLSALAYRLFGDDEYYLSGIAKKDVVSRVSFQYPFFSSESPTFVILPPQEDCIKQYLEEFGGADFTVLCSEAAEFAHMEEMIDGLVLETLSESEVSMVTKEAGKIFPMFRNKE